MTSKDLPLRLGHARRSSGGFFNMHGASVDQRGTSASRRWDGRCTRPRAGANPASRRRTGLRPEMGDYARAPSLRRRRPHTAQFVEDLRERNARFRRASIETVSDALRYFAQSTGVDLCVRQFPDPRFKLVTALDPDFETPIEIPVQRAGSSHGCAGRMDCRFRRMVRPQQRLGVAMMIGVVSLCSTPAQSGAPSGTPPAVTSRVTADVVDLTNVERVRNGRASLRANARLMHAAQIQADQMARAGQLAHVLANAAYPSAGDRLAAADYRWQAYGENVALGQLSAKKALDGWMHSRGHRTNILNPNFTEMGAGYAIDRERRPYYVQVFARPLS